MLPNEYVGKVFGRPYSVFSAYQKIIVLQEGIVLHNLFKPTCWQAQVLFSTCGLDTSRERILVQKSHLFTQKFNMAPRLASNDVPSAAPMVLDFTKETFASGHYVAHIRASPHDDWEGVVEVCGAVLKYTLCENAKLFLQMLEVEDLVRLYRVNFPLGDHLMWMCIAKHRTDIAVRLPVLRTFKVTRLTEREIQRQELFNDMNGRS